MASDSAIRKRLVEILRTADLNVTTERSIRKQLEQEFSVDLTERKKLIRQEVENYLNRNNQDANENEDGANSVGGTGNEGNGNEECDERIDEEHHNESQSSKKRKSREVKTKPSKEPKVEKKRGGGGGLKQVCRLSTKLASIVGYSELPRTQVVKEVWNYIRKHNLQDPDNKRRIICDDAMQELFNTPSTDMFHMNKLLSAHIFRMEANDDGESAAKKVKSESAGSGKGGFCAPQPLSPELQHFFGGVKELPRSEVTKKMWQYIKEHNLQDADDKRNIICDDKLKSLLGITSFNGFGMAKFLAPHFLKPGSQVKSDNSQNNEVKDQAEGGEQVKEEGDGVQEEEDEED